MHAAKINHLFVANTRWRHHSKCEEAVTRKSQFSVKIVRDDFLTRFMPRSDSFYRHMQNGHSIFEEYRIVSVDEIINFAPEWELILYIPSFTRIEIEQWKTSSS